MEQSRSTEIKVGLITLIATVLLVGGIILGEELSITPSGPEIHIRLQHSGGLDNGSPVMINGVERGRVTNVASDNGSVLATVEVDDIDDLRDDAFARVTMLEITGGKKVEISTGMGSGSFDPTQEMPGETASDISDLVTQVGDVSGDLVRLLRRIDTITAAITEVLKDSSFVENLSSIANDGAILMSDARIWFQANRSELSTTVKDARAAIADLRRVVNENEPALTSSLQKLDARLTEMESTLNKADIALDDIDSLVVNANGIVTDIRTNDGFAHAALYDTNFRRRIDTAIMRLNGFVRFAREKGVNVNIGVGHK